MSRNLVAASIAGGAGLAVLIALVALGGAMFDRTQARYPGAVAVGDDELHAGWRALSVTRQAEYHTDDSLGLVRAWYRARLGVAAAADLAPDGLCTPLAHARLVLHVEHALAVLVCADAHGTSVVVNERLTWWP
jgi:hypothetical protein